MFQKEKEKKKEEKKREKEPEKPVKPLTTEKVKFLFLKKSKIIILLYASIKDFLDIYEMSIVSFSETNHVVNPPY